MYFSELHYREKIAYVQRVDAWFPGIRRLHLIEIVGRYGWEYERRLGFVHKDFRNSSSSIPTRHTMNVPTGRTDRMAVASFLFQFCELEGITMKRLHELELERASQVVIDF